MNREAIYETWVAKEGAWSLWARPVLFGQMSATPGGGPQYPTPIRWAWDLFGQTPDETSGITVDQPWRTMPVDWAPPPADNAVLILDLPGAEAVHLGLALAGRGYRPVPLYNGCTGPSELIELTSILRALRSGAAYLAALHLAAEAPPVFLLDSRRRTLPRPLQSGMLDNRWLVFPEDLPSASLLRQRGVSRVVLIGRGKPLDDLARVLRSWQEAGIALATKDMTDAELPHRLIVPLIPWYHRWFPWYHRWWYGLLAKLGQRSRRDGFGYIVPTRTQG